MPVPPRGQQALSRFEDKPVLAEWRGERQDTEKKPEGDVFEQLKGITRKTPRDQDRTMERLESLVKDKKKK